MKFYLTTPIYYVNDSPHIGHAYTTVAADVLARWHRLHGKEVFFLTGTDEHGAKICQAALKCGQQPDVFCTRIAQEFKDAWKIMNISYDSFIRTTDSCHIKAVREFLAKLFNAGHIFKGKYEGLYCVNCEKFLSEADLVDGMCPDHKQKPVAHSEENYFFRLSAFREKLIDILSRKELQVLPEERHNEIIGKLKTGLEDISISRASLEWGIPLPFDEKQTAYVWIDALLNYVSGAGYPCEQERFNSLWPADLHLMAKDILWFHSVIWPAMLLAIGLKLPKKVFAHGFFTIDGQKMSKTLGNSIKPQELTGRFGVDASRYLILSLFPFGADGDISWDSLKSKYNTDLANNLGNLVARSLTMLHKYVNGIVPPLPSGTGGLELIEIVARHLNSAGSLLEDLSFTQYIFAIQSAANLVNQYIDQNAPWKMAKENNPKLQTVLFNLVGAISVITPYLIPVMPETAGRIWALLGEKITLEEAAAGYFAGAGKPPFSFPVPGTATNKPVVLFPRIV